MIGSLVTIEQFVANKSSWQTIEIRFFQAGTNIGDVIHITGIKVSLQ
jgi:hypothetical protein